MGYHNRIKEGETGVNNQGSSFIVETYIDRKNVVIKFTDKYEHRQTVASWDVRRGTSYNPFHPTTYGIGYRGVGVDKRNHLVEADRWLRMMDRCYSDKPLTYKNCTVDEKWHNFQEFYKWMQGKYEHFVEQNVKFHLDKDVLSETIPGKFYSENTCCILPASINLIIKSDLNNPNPGLFFRNGKIWVHTSNLAKKIHLGVFKLEDEHLAQEKYRTTKAEILSEHIEKNKHLLTPQVIENLFKIVEQIKRKNHV